MAESTLKFRCCGCDAEFEVPSELAGEAGECTECSAIFRIPGFKKASLGKSPTDTGTLSKTDTGTIKAMDASDEEPTNTVKLSRTGIGMVPNLKADPSGFKVDVIKRQRKTQTSLNLDEDVADGDENGDGEVEVGKARSKIHTKAGGTFTKTKIKRPVGNVSKGSGGKPGLGAAAAAKPKKKWWQFWK